MGGLVGERVDALVCHAVAELLKGRLVLEMSRIVKSARCGDLPDITLIFIHGTSRERFTFQAALGRASLIWTTPMYGTLRATDRLFARVVFVNYVRSGDACCR